MRKSFSSDSRAQWKCDYKQVNVVHPREHMLGCWWIVCDTNPQTQPSEHGPGTGAEQERKRGEPFWCTEIIGSAHNHAICYLLKFPPLLCQDKSGNIHGTRALQQRPGVFSLNGKFTESLYTGSWELWSGFSPNWNSSLHAWGLIQLPRKVQAGWLFSIKSRQKWSTMSCVKKKLHHKRQVLENDFQIWF